MSDRLVIPAADNIKWEFQIERQGFMVRYGRAGGEFYKQMITGFGGALPNNQIKRIERRSFVLAHKLSR